MNNTLIDNAEDLDVVIQVYNRLQYSDIYSITLEGLWNYYKDGLDGVDDNGKSQGKSLSIRQK